MAPYSDRAISIYKEEMRDLLMLSFPRLSENDINGAIDYSIQKRFKDTDITLDNNY